MLFRYALRPAGLAASLRLLSKPSTSTRAPHFRPAALLPRLQYLARLSSSEVSPSESSPSESSASESSASESSASESSASESSPSESSAPESSPSESSPSESSSKSWPLPPTITPPWQISDLKIREQKAYAEHGPDYLDHIPRNLRSKALHAAKWRAKHGAKLEARYGEGWYAMFVRARERWNNSPGGLQREPTSLSGEERWKERLEWYKGINRQKHEAIDKYMDEEFAAAGGKQGSEDTAGS